MNWNKSSLALLIAGLAALFFVPGLGAVHLFDWDEINFAEISREMILLQDYSRVHVNFEPFWEKPPLFFWMQVLAMKVFGVGEFAARLPNALCGVVTLLVLFRIGTRIKDELFGLLWVVAYAASILPHLYFKSGIIDPWFNLFIFLGLYYFIAAQSPPGEQVAQGSSTYLTLLGGIFLGLAMLTKGQVAFMIFTMVTGVYWLLSFLQPANSWQLLKRWIKPLLILVGAMATVTFLWFGYETWKNGPWFIQEFLTYQYRLFSTPDAGHVGFPGYHFVVLLFGCFPASIFAIQEMVKPAAMSIKETQLRRWMMIFFWTVLILFTIVKSKIVHYSSLCYFPLTYLATLQVYRIWKEQRSFGWSRFLLGGIGTLIAALFIAVPLAAQKIDTIRGLFDKDPFTQANLLADVQWTGLEILPGLILIGGLLSAHFLHGAGKYRASLMSVGLGGILFVPLALYFFINRVEGYSQNAAIQFYEERQGEDCYVITEGHRSYAHLFYTRKPPFEEEPSKQEMLHENVGKTVYVVSKIHKAERVEHLPGFEKIGAKNGFVFFKKTSKGSP